MKDEKRECRYASWFPPYKPSKQFHIYFINTATTNQEINNLLNILQVPIEKLSTLSALIFSDTDDDSHNMLTVHELNEQQSSSLHHPLAQLSTTGFNFSASVMVVNQPNDTQNAPTKVKPKS
ncbi:unnamed protein product [Adineta steineri]|uniref:Uncharacterized protein n=1 Tax=Adineta steineri TaxID=433720 RepID=A0A819U8N5_9BILA|nr:unnamed protein product [Adineta steineri]